MDGKLTKYFKYRKINKYLKSKDLIRYNHLDYIFEDYVNGNLQKTLEDYQFSRINIYPLVGRKGNYLQIECWFYNLIVDVGFDDDCFDYVVYLPGESADEFSKSVVTNDYSCDFKADKFFEIFYNMLQKDSRLKKTK